MDKHLAHKGSIVIHIQCDSAAQAVARPRAHGGLRNGAGSQGHLGPGPLLPMILGTCVSANVCSPTEALQVHAGGATRADAGGAESAEPYAVSTRLGQDTS